MKKMQLKIFAIFLIILSACKSPSGKASLYAKNTMHAEANSDSIFKIIVSRNSGDGPSSETVITKDSITLTYSRHYYSSEPIVTRKKTALPLWDSLIALIKLNDIDKVGSHPGHMRYDGVDVTIMIKAHSDHYFINGEEDTMNYKKVMPLVRLLNSIQNRFMQ